PARDVEAAQFRQAEVANHQIEFVVIKTLDRFGASRRFDNIVAFRPEGLVQNLANSLFVFDHQHSRRFCSDSRLYWRGYDWRSCFVKGQNHLEASSLARLAGYVYIPAVVFNNSVRCGKPEPGATIAFGRIERFEDARNHFGSHAGASVGNPEARGLR